MIETFTFSILVIFQSGALQQTEEITLTESKLPLILNA